MLIFTNKVDWEKVKKFTYNPESALKYVDSLVPEWARHIQNIQNNQRYFVAVYMRNVYSIPYKDRMNLVKVLTDGISLSGLSTGFVALDELIDACDKETLKQALMEVSDIEDNC